MKTCIKVSAGLLALAATVSCGRQEADSYLAEDDPFGILSHEQIVLGEKLDDP